MKKYNLNVGPNISMLQTRKDLKSESQLFFLFKSFFPLHLVNIELTVATGGCVHVCVHVCREGGWLHHWKKAAVQKQQSKDDICTKRVMRRKKNKGRTWNR